MTGVPCCEVPGALSKQQAMNTLIVSGGLGIAPTQKTTATVDFRIVLDLRAVTAAFVAHSECLYSDQRIVTLTCEVLPRSSTARSW